jgi:dTDP-glucose 4,6-dehydratase
VNLLVTGGAGFIGSNYIRFLLRTDPDARIVNLDKLTYAGNLDSLGDAAADPRYAFVRGDIADRQLVDHLLRSHRIDSVINFAAESHVDRSIVNPEVFVTTNVLGTQNLLFLARENKIQRFLQVSTDEVYGSLGPEGKFHEDTPLAPNSPYSAAKTSADLLCRAWFHTFGFPVVVTRCSNNYGPYQFPEKLIPLMIINALNDRELPVYGDGLNVRDWIFVEDHCRAIDVVFRKGRAGEVYNIGGDCERRNIDIVRQVLGLLGKPESLIRFVKDRPGHDRRYAMDNTKIRAELGWAPAVMFENGLRLTVDWYLSHRSWWEKVMTGEYLTMYERIYGGKR